MEPLGTPGSASERGPTCTPLDAFRRQDLVDGSGTTYDEFRRRQRPRFGLVWTHLLAGYGALVATTVLTVLLERAWPRGWPLATLGCAALVGHFSAYVQLFFHEAAHFNLAPSRRGNDRLANLFIGSLVGQDVRAYRIIHFDHHRHLGTDRDTEHGYFDALNARFVLESLVGIKAWRVLAERRRILESKSKGATYRPSVLPVLVGAIVHGSVIGAGIAAGSRALVGGWILGTVVGVPFFTALRQLLEHRAMAGARAPENAESEVPAVTRMFGSGPLPGTFGGAGFNRHLLHHWDPQLSYTRLADLERFLLGTQAAPAVRAMRTSYARAMTTLFER